MDIKVLRTLKQAPKFMIQIFRHNIHYSLALKQKLTWLSNM